MRGKAAKPSQLPAGDSTPESKVLGDENLLGEILYRVDSPAILVCAALVSRSWLRRASDRAFLRRFRECHSPRLLGFYVTGELMLRPEFVPMPPNTELSAALRRAGSVFDAFPPYSSRVCGSRNGRVLFDFTRTVDGCWRFAVLDTLRHPGGAMVELPPLPLSSPRHFHGILLPEDDDDDATCYRVDFHPAIGSVSAQVQGYIVGVDLATADMFAIELPEGVSYEYYGNLVPARGDDSVLYLFHITEDRLSIWRRKMHGRGGDGEWVLRDTISVKEACGDVERQGSESWDDDDDSFFPIVVVGVGDNAEFVFLELGNSGIIVYLNLGSRRAEKVYQSDLKMVGVTEVHPFFMVWPPVFPALAPSDE